MDPTGRLSVIKVERTNAKYPTGRLSVIKTVEICLFFFFIHILICSDSKIVLKHILGSEFCKMWGGRGKVG